MVGNSVGNSLGFAAFDKRALFSLRSDARAPTRIGVIAAVAALHVVLFAGLLQHQSFRRALVEALPLTVTIITPPRPEPVAQQAMREHSPLKMPEAPVFPLPPVAIAIAPVPDAPTPVTATAPPPSPQIAAAITLVQPRFDADYLQNPAPAYPVLSKHRGERGKVILRVMVGANGLPEKVDVQASSGFERLDTAAQETVKHWKFVPARRGDTAIAGWVLVPISFSLNS